MDKKIFKIEESDDDDDLSISAEEDESIIRFLLLPLQESEKQMKLCAKHVIEHLNRLEKDKVYAIEQMEWIKQWDKFLIKDMLSAIQSIKQGEDVSLLLDEDEDELLNIYIRNHAPPVELFYGEFAFKILEC